MAAENNPSSARTDADPQETREWQEALAGVIENEGTERAHFLIEQVIAKARERGITLPYSATTEYVNTIPVDKQPQYPGDPTIEIRIRNYIRWNAMAMVVRANRDTSAPRNAGADRPRARRLHLQPHLRDDDARRAGNGLQPRRDAAC